MSSEDREQSDATLVERARTGEREAFGVLYRRHQAVVYRFARAMTGSNAIAEDVVQEVFLALMKEIERYDASRASLRTYLFGVARNISRYRARGLRRLTTLDAADGAVAPDDPSAAIIQSDRVRHVRTGIATLPSRYREVVLLCDVHGLSYIEAAGALRVPVGTVRSRLHRGRQQLLEWLNARAQRAARSEGPKQCVI